MKDFAGPPSILITTGGTLPNGSILDLFMPVGENRMNFVHWTPGKAVIAPFIEVTQITYQPPNIDDSLLQVMRFPSQIGGYTSADKLTTETATVVQRILSIDPVTALALAAWIRATWFPDCSPAPATLLLYAADAQTASVAFQVLRAMTRRGLQVAEINSHLPLELAPTLLLQNSTLSPKQRRLYALANHKGVVVPTRGSRVYGLTCSKAICMNSSDDADVWGAEALSIFLPPAKRGLLGDSELAQITADFQALFLRFRLENLAAVTAGIPQPPEPLNDSDLARALLLGVWEEPDVLQAITPLLKAQEEVRHDSKGLNPYAAILECLWGPAHDTDSLSVTEIQKRVHALLHSRGEMLEFGTREIGWKLTHLNLQRKREGRGMHLPFSGATSSRIHELVQQYGLNLPQRIECSDCQSSLASSVVEPVGMM